MGGLLFGTQRMKVREFNGYRKTVEDILRFYDIEFKIPLYYRSKQDFGDLDVLVKTTTTIEDLKNIFKTCECHYEPKSETIISFNFRNFQIDFIRVNPDDFDISFEYYSYNDLGNLIGQLAKANYLKYGFDGLRYDHYFKNQKIGTIPISKNIDKILLFLDLSPAVYHQGFDSMEEVFDYVTTSKFFNPYVYELEPYGYSKAGVALYRLNKMNRERNSKRKTYQEWLEYIKKFKTGEENYKFREDRDIEEVFERIDKFFPNTNFRDKIKNLLNAEEDKKKIKQKFNGNVIISLLPDLQKQDFQFFIDSFKARILKVYTTFDKYIEETDQDSINRDIVNYFNDIFKKKYL
jgi:hypothetical protein